MWGSVHLSSNEDDSRSPEGGDGLENLMGWGPDFPDKKKSRRTLFENNLRTI
jgi:hypothetical protein